MKKKLDPVVVGVIIAVCVILTLVLFGVFILNTVSASKPRPDERFDTTDIKTDVSLDDIEEDNEIEENDNTNNNISDNNSLNNNSTNREFTMKCSKNTERGLEENIFTFNYNPIYNDNYITKFIIKLTIPDGLDINDYYTSEQIMNGGRYRMSLDGRTIISEIDPTWAFWNSDGFKYKDMAYRYINKQFVEDGYICE